LSSQGENQLYVAAGTTDGLIGIKLLIGTGFSNLTIPGVFTIRLIFH
jgi:hypothetical protein